ncbi:alpha/beta fold hydrolase [Streptacidiphilus sp. N1-12]|uniref:Alpha/beta fold hydrolase n=2 Tax=Streptacidiphilus alkalitolerans TaxID=3342712 RepID=A0ABV6WAM0_9ACTN
MTTMPDTAAETRRSTVTGPSGVPLAVYSAGDPARPTVLLVHGYPDTHTVWDDVAADLAADHQVVRYDVRGAGGSGRPGPVRDYRLDLLADDLFAVAQAVSPDRPVHLVAHDWGSVQSWEAVTTPGAEARIASFTTVSGPCLDHVGHWQRRRALRPTPRHLLQLANQMAHSWYIAAFHVPVLAPALWRFRLARRWPTLLRVVEGVPERAGHPQPTLAEDAVHGIKLYRANMLPRVLRPRSRPTRVPVQLVTLTRDNYVRPALNEDLERWAPGLRRRTMDTGHWAALLVRGPELAALVRSFATEREPAPQDAPDAAS